MFWLFHHFRYNQRNKLMRILVLSDIHANLAALEAVIADAGTFEKIWCLGDVVGYGPQPNECIDRLRQFDFSGVAGNHDLGVVGKTGLWDFTQEAREMIFFTRHWLSAANFQWLEKLTEKTLGVGHGFTLVHASPRDPVWETITEREVARDNLELMQTPYYLNGHTHMPVVFRWPAGGLKVLQETLRPDAPLALNGDQMFINPGSVGQPRDEDPRAAYAVIDLAEQTVTHRRVKYNVALTQELMKQAKISPRLVRRLSFGQ